MEDKWDKFLSKIKKEWDDTTFEVFLKPISLRVCENIAVFSAPNRAIEIWIKKNFNHQFQTFLNENALENYKIVTEKINPSTSTEENSPHKTPPPTPLFSKTNLRPHLTFDNFVSGHANELALVAARAIAHSDKNISPLFIYGGTGMGKTHLVHAIGNFYKKNFPQRHILYTNARSFLNDFVRACRLQNIDSFKERYQNLDLLIVDDIQYLGGDKGRTQEEFFFLFNALYDNGKEVVLTCDRAPSQIRDMPSRLTSRFNCGVPSYITPPEFEMRVNIIRSKAIFLEIHLDEESIFFIAEHIQSNVRELEGGIKRVAAMARFQGVTPSLAICQRALADFIGRDNALILPTTIREKICTCYSLKDSDLNSPKRQQSIALPRHIAMYLCRKLTQLSLPEIGRLFGKRNHTTVLHSCKLIDSKIKSSSSFEEEIKLLEMSIRESHY